MRERFVDGEEGFTLPEVLVTMVMMITVLFALYSIFDMSIRVFSFGNDKVEAVENARIGLARMEREIRSAYPYNKAGTPTPDTKLFAVRDQSQITFGNDRNGNRRVDVPSEEITYSLNNSTRTLQRANPSNGTLRPVVESVAENGLRFTYLKRDGTVATSEGEVEMVRIELTVNVRNRIQTLSTNVALRNRGN